MRSFLSKILAGSLVFSLVPTGLGVSAASATTCDDLQVVFARGSGENLGGENFRAFKSAVSSELQRTAARVSTAFYDLGTSAHGGKKYPAVAANNLAISAGAVLSAGGAYKYGSSVSDGVIELKNFMSETLKKCPKTKFVLAGYSQGAQVVTAASKDISANSVIYTATFGDPKLYLPEGEGIIPAACRNSNFSAYRTNVPDCHTSAGILGAEKPYRLSTFLNKSGTWCNDHDLMCGSRWNFNDLIGAHLTYSSNGRYEEAAKIIAEKAKSIFKSSGQVSIGEKRLYSVISFIDEATYTEDTPKKLMDTIRQNVDTTSDELWMNYVFHVYSSDTESYYNNGALDISEYPEFSENHYTGFLFHHGGSIESCVRYAFTSESSEIHNGGYDLILIINPDHSITKLTYEEALEKYHINPEIIDEYSISSFSLDTTSLSEVDDFEPENSKVAIKSSEYRPLEHKLILSLDIPENTEYLSVALNDAPLGIVKRSSLENNLLIITDIDEDITNNLFIQDIGKSGYPGETTSFALARKNQPKKISLTGVLVPDCGVPKGN